VATIAQQFLEKKQEQEIDVTVDLQEVQQLLEELDLKIQSEQEKE